MIHHCLMKGRDEMVCFFPKVNWGYRELWKGRIPHMTSFGRGMPKQTSSKKSECVSLSHRSNFCSIEVIMMAKQLLLSTELPNSRKKKFNRILWWSLIPSCNNPIRCRCWQDHLNWPTLKILQLLVFCKHPPDNICVTTLSHSNSLNNRGGCCWRSRQLSIV